MESAAILIVLIYSSIHNTASCLGFSPPAFAIKTVGPSSTTKPVQQSDGIRKHTQHILLYSNNSDAINDNDSMATQSSNSEKHLSAAQQERREEDKRRKLREGDIKPGTSSAIPGAQDFAINVQKTEREYLESLSTSDDDSIIDERNVDKYVAVWTEEGLDHLRMLHFQEAYDSFNKVYQIKPEAYLWQDGLLKYYLEEYHEAAESLAKNAVRYETRFMEPASEERIWRDACELKIVHTIYSRKMKNQNVPAAIRVALQEGIDEEQSEKESIGSERRKVMRLARQLFSNSLRNNAAGVSLAQAQLQAMCGDSFPPSLKSTLPTMPMSDENQQQQSSFQSTRPDRKMYKLHSLFYLGLYYDALGQSKESKQCMKMALKTCANSIGGNNQDITYLLPVIHMTIRDWYDDDEDFYEDEDTEEEFDISGGDDFIAELVSDGGVELNVTDGDDSVGGSSSNDRRSEIQRVRDSIKDMRVIDLKEELKKRGLGRSGRKAELQKRLRDYLSSSSAN